MRNLANNNEVTDRICNLPSPESLSMLILNREKTTCFANASYYEMNRFCALTWNLITGIGWNRMSCLRSNYYSITYCHQLSGICPLCFVIAKAGLGREELNLVKAILKAGKPLI